MDKYNRMKVNIVPEDGPLRSESTQHTTKEELRIIHSTVGVNDVTTLKLFGHLNSDVGIREKKIPKL